MHLYNFATVCDGASANLSAITLLAGFGAGVYGNKPPGSCVDIHEVQAWFINPLTNQKFTPSFVLPFSHMYTYVYV